MFWLEIKGKKSCKVHLTIRYRLTKCGPFFLHTDHMFYTNTPNSGTIIPKLGSISAYQSAIEAGKKNLDNLNHQQYLLMLKNDIPGMDALDEPIKKAEQDIDNLKIGLGDIMGANVHGASGNQLTGSGWFGRMMGLGETEKAIGYRI